MTQYAISAREQYDRDGDKDKFIRTVCDGIIRHLGKEQIPKKATAAFLDLTKERGEDSWINGTDVLVKAINRKTYSHNLHYGLWPWMEKTGAGVIQEQVKVSNTWVDASTIQNLAEYPDKRYKVKREFYAPLWTVCKVIKGW